jgi:hypothetical protein
MAWGRRCDAGCETWPDEAIYVRCPVCGEETERWSNLEPLDADEARTILLYAQFEIYYARRCERLGIPADGPLPHDLPAHGTAVVATDSQLMPGQRS